jgi:RND family efflux transporter MFP subunit
MKKIIITLVVLVCLGLVGRQIYLRISRQKDSGNRRGARPVPVEVTPVVRRDMRDVAEFTGTLLPESLFVVAPKVSGRLEKLMVNIGEPVRNGDLIAVLDSDEYSQQVAQARAELEVSRAGLADSHSTLEVSAREYERAKELREQKVASEAELDTAKARHEAAQAKYEVAQAQIKQKQAALKAAEVRLSYTRIQAVWEEGESPRMVAERFVDEGAMLRANDPIVSIVDLSTVLAVINVIERDFPDISVGQIATITTDAYPGREFTGTVARRAPVLKEESRQARVEIEIPNPENLLAPGMFIRARIQFSEHPAAVVVPFSALVRRDGHEGVFLIEAGGNKARFVPCTAGFSEGEWVEIIRPELKGQVVTLGQHLLEDGADVTVAGDAASPAGGPAANMRGKGT